MSDPITQGMMDAETRYSGGMLPAQIMEQYRAIQARPKAELQQYGPIEQDMQPQVETIKAVNLAMKASAIAFPVAGACGLYTVLVSGALNVVLAYVIAGAGGMLLFSALFGGSAAKVEDCPTQRGKIRESVTIRQTQTQETIINKY